MAVDLWMQEKAKNGAYANYPGDLRTDLQEVLNRWVSRYVNPMGTVYANGYDLAMDVYTKASATRKKHEAALAEIQFYQQIAMSVMLIGVEIFAGAAISKVKVFSRFSHKKSMSHFVSKTDLDTKTALTQFLNQKDSLADLMLAGLDGKLVDLGKTGASASGRILKANIQSKKATITKNLSQTGAKPRIFQNDLNSFFRETKTAALSFCDKALIDPYRKDEISKEQFQAMVQLFTAIPFCLPPKTSIAPVIKDAYKNWFAGLIWIDAVIAKAKDGKHKNLFVCGTQDVFTAREINKLVHNASGYHFTNTGMKQGAPSTHSSWEWGGYVDAGFSKPALKARNIPCEGMSAFFTAISR